MIKIVLSYRLSTDVPVFSVYGHLFSGWRTATYLYGGLYTIRGYGEEYFFLNGWPHNIRIGHPPSPYAIYNCS
jgi:hypothetical protein